jgi:hypothetical protein
VEDWDVGDRDVDGDAGVEVAAPVFGERSVGWWEDDGTVYFVAGWHCVLLFGRVCVVEECGIGSAGGVSDSIVDGGCAGSVNDLIMKYGCWRSG